MSNIDSIFKSRDITLPTKVHLVKAMVFPVVMYGCESWTVHAGESPLLSRSGGEKGLKGSGAGTLGADDARGWQCPFVLCLHPQGCLRRGIRASGPSQGPQRRVVWMWFGAFPGAFGLGRAQPQPPTRRVPPRGTPRVPAPLPLSPFSPADRDRRGASGYRARGSRLKDRPGWRGGVAGGTRRGNLGEGNGTPLQYSCLENPMDRGAW